MSRRSRSVPAVGVSLDALVTAARPILPNAKNALLQATVTAADRWGRSVTFVLGELDPNFGAHDAVVVLSIAGIPPLTGPACPCRGTPGWPAIWPT